MPEILKNEVPIVKVDRKKRLVYGIVYEPMQPDSQDHYMRADEIEKMAHNYMINSRDIDYSHDFSKRHVVPVESFIVRKGDPDYPEGSWVVVTKIFDDDMWKKVLKGEIRAYSMAGMAEFGKSLELESRWYDDKGNYKSVWDNYS